MQAFETSSQLRRTCLTSGVRRIGCLMRHHVPADEEPTSFVELEWRFALAVLENPHDERF